CLQSAAPRSALPESSAPARVPPAKLPLRALAHCYQHTHCPKASDVRVHYIPRPDGIDLQHAANIRIPISRVYATTFLQNIFYDKDDRQLSGDPPPAAETCFVLCAHMGRAQVYQTLSAIQTTCFLLAISAVDAYRPGPLDDDPSSGSSAIFGKE